jgi:hypothetical protein
MSSDVAPSFRALAQNQASWTRLVDLALVIVCNGDRSLVSSLWLLLARSLPPMLLQSLLPEGHFLT